MPQLLITMGVTGAGKSKLAKEVIRKLKIKDPHYFLIDDYVEKDEYYKKMIKNFTKKGNYKKKLKKPSKKTIKYFSKYYFETRNTKGCKKKTKRLKKRISRETKKKECIDFENNKGCNYVFEQELNDAILKKKNIIFETNGKYYPKWLIKSVKKCSRYTTIIAGVKVSIRNLIKRNSSRVLEDMEKFLEDNKEAPRFPDISEEELKKNKKLFEKTIKQTFINKCLEKEYDKKKCGFKLDRLLIYNNNTSLKLTYDSNN